MATHADGTFRARIGERAFDVHLSGAAVEVDGAAVDVSFEPVGDGSFSLLAAGRSVQATVQAMPDGLLRVTLDGRMFDVRVQDERELLLERFGLAPGAQSGGQEVKAPMPGLVLKVLAEEGAAIKAGDGLVVLEAMKMENELRAPSGGTVKKIHVQPGEAVVKNALLVELA